MVSSLKLKHVTPIASRDLALRPAGGQVGGANPTPNPTRLNGDTMATRARPYAFLKVGDRWINMSMVTDIEDRGDGLVVYLATDMARLAGADRQAVDVARRFTVDDPQEVEKVKRWLLLNDED
jgi:hypothetical protein